MIFILYICLHKKRQNASCSFECENRVSTEKRQEMGEGRSESGQWRLLVINVPKRLLPVQAFRKFGSAIAMRAKLGAPGVPSGGESHTRLFSSDRIPRAQRLAESLTV